MNSLNVVHKAKIFKIKDINENLSCFLCKGYLIDATTIIECLHSFCRSCLILYLKANKTCPVCKCLIHKTKPLLNIRSDATLQDLVFKLIPGLYQEEIRKRKEFFQSNTNKNQGDMTPNYKSLVVEGNDDYYNIDVYLAHENINIELKYIVGLSNKSDNSGQKLLQDYKRYLQCQASFTIESLKKFIQKKYSIPYIQQIELYCSTQYLHDAQTLLDIACYHSWQREVPLEILFAILEPCYDDLKEYANENPTFSESDGNETKSCSIEDIGKNSEHSEPLSLSSQNLIASKGPKLSKTKGSANSQAITKNDPTNKNMSLVKKDASRHKKNTSTSNLSLKDCGKGRLENSSYVDPEPSSEQILTKVTSPSGHQKGANTLGIFSSPTKDDRYDEEMIIMEEDNDESRKDLMKIVDRACSKLILEDNGIDDSKNDGLNLVSPMEQKIDGLKGSVPSIIQEPICREMAEALLCLSGSVPNVAKGKKAT